MLRRQGPHRLSIVGCKVLQTMERPSTLAITSLILGLLQALLLALAIDHSDDPAPWIVLSLCAIATIVLGGISISRAKKLNLGGGKVAIVAVILGVGGCLVGGLGSLLSAMFGR
jgi:drug/metabolite transporter (DMT)-like permease